MPNPRIRIALALLVVAVVIGVLWQRRSGPTHYTGFVEGEERLLRSEVAARVLEVLVREGDTVPAGAVVARLDPAEIRARIASKAQEITMLDADAARAEEQLSLIERTWERDLEARRAELRRSEAGSHLASRTYRRTEKLTADGVSSEQRLDDVRARRDESTSATDVARELALRAEAEGRNVEVMRRSVTVARQRRELASAQLGELRVLEAKHEVRAPDVPTVLQTQLIWAGELAQPGSPIAAVLAPDEKYVQIYLPVAETAQMGVGTRVEIELDGIPGRRFPGEVSFVADRATFTPEKIESRSDRLGQVYRAKVRILEDAAQMPAGAEGSVYPTAATRVATGATP